MRATFVKTLAELMRKDARIIALTADMGYGVFEDLQKEFPNRFINVGVAEANMAGISAGLALSGYTVFIYAQATFVTMRCFEQVRLDIASNNLNVKIIGTSAGFTLSHYGVSHFSVEDVSLMRALPSMTIFSPGDKYEAEAVVRASVKIKGPVYIRIGNSNDYFHARKPKFEVGKMIAMSRGRRGAALIVTGSMMQNAMRAVVLLKQKGVAASLWSAPTIRPLDKKKILELAVHNRAIFTLEEHIVIGGFGSAVVEAVADSASARKARIVRLGVDNGFLHITGSREYLLSRCGLAPEQIAQSVTQVLRRL